MKTRRHRGSSGRDNSPKLDRWRDVHRVLFWSGVFNLLLTTVFMGTLVYSEAHLADKSPAAPPGNQATDPVAQSRPLRSDLETSTKRTARVADQRKGSLAFTQIAAMTAINSNPSEEILEKPPVEQEEKSPLAQERGASPVLRKSPATGQLEIKNFSTMSFEGSSEECPEFGVSMLEFADTSPDLLEILASSDEITVARICAANGSVILTCRNEQITLSSRRARPNDGCHRQGLLADGTKPTE